MSWRTLTSSQPSSEERPSTEPSSDVRLAPLPLLPTSPLESHKSLSALQELPPATVTRILDWDCETIAAGFDDPQWVPHKITCVAWSWIGSDEINARISTSEGLFSRPERRRKMLEPLLEAIGKADMVTGHNLIRFDLPVLNAECLRLGFPSLGGILVQDTMRLVRTKGFKKGQDNISYLLDVPINKIPLTWQQWQDAYEEKGWATVVERCKSDVAGHKLMRQEMMDRKWLRAPIRWNP